MDGFHTHALKRIAKIRVFSPIAAAEMTSFTFSTEHFDSQITCAIRGTIWSCVCKQHLNGRSVTYSETQQKTGLPHARVSDQQELEQVITETQTRGTLMQSVVSCVTWKWELHYATRVCHYVSTITWPPWNNGSKWRNVTSQAHTLHPNQKKLNQQQEIHSAWYKKENVMMQRQFSSDSDVNYDPCMCMTDSHDIAVLC